MFYVFPWIEQVVLPGVFWTEDYRGKPVSTYDQTFISNMYAQRLGPVKLRQLRVTPGNAQYIA